MTERVPSADAAARLAAELTGRHRASGLRFGDPRMLDFFDALGRRMLRPDVVREHPELGQLGMFLRRNSLAQRVSGSAAPHGYRRVPRGLALHIPPANVAPLLCYSWALSAVTGNANVVRVSGRPSPVITTILRLVAEVPAPPVISETQRLVAYPHDDGITAAFSAACRLRVLWGGDATVSALRGLPLPPGATEVTFPDRSSFTVVCASAWLSASPADRLTTVRRFYRDAYWYDGAACSSPRTVCWVGPETVAAQAREGFLGMLAAEVVARSPEVDAATSVEQRVRTYGLALTGAARSLRFPGPALGTVELTGPERMPDGWLGTGTFAHCTVPTLSGVVPAVGYRHQTVTYFGFSAGELSAFADEVAVRGVDRVVPVGEALLFDSTWDGYDLPQAFSRTVRVPIGGHGDG
jgi:hypothetical protein